MAKKEDKKSLSLPELLAKRGELEKKYMDFRFQMVVGHVDNKLEKRRMRREIATVNTFIRQKELGSADGLKK